MLENFDYSTAQTGDIVVSACQELLEKDESKHTQRTISGSLEKAQEQIPDDFAICSAVHSFYLPSGDDFDFLKLYVL